MIKSTIQTGLERMTEDHGESEDLAALYDSIAKDWTRDQPEVRDDLIAWPLLIEKTKTLGAGGVLLDIGCGTGNIARLLSRYVKAVVGIDIAKNMISEADRLSSDYPNIHYLRSDMAKMTRVIAPASIDLAVSIFGFCCAKDRANLEKAFSETHAALRPGAFLIAQIPHPLQPFFAVSSKWAHDLNRPESYFEEGAIIRRRLRMANGKEIVVGRHHFSLEAQFEALINAGFSVREFLEPTPSEELLARFPDLAHEARLPSSIVLVLQSKTKTS